MSLLENFSENTDIFKARDNRIDQDAFEALTKKHGEDVARGYVKAMAEVMQVLNELLVVEVRDGQFDPNTPTNVFGRVSNLHKALFEFLKINDAAPDTLKPILPFRTRSQNF